MKQVILIALDVAVQHDHRNTRVHRLFDRARQRARFFGADDHQVHLLLYEFAHLRLLRLALVLRVALDQF